ncbi:hypothetical protein IGI37_000692 [Enterococcus sp. AZ194]
MITRMSDSGKTTLLNILSHLETFDEEVVYYNTVSLVDSPSPKFSHEELGHLFQNFSLLDGQTIQENLDLGFAGRKASPILGFRKSKPFLYKLKTTNFHSFWR